MSYSSVGVSFSHTYAPPPLSPYMIGHACMSTMAKAIPTSLIDLFISDGCCIFAHVACCAPTTRQAIVKAGACKIITDAMVAHTKKDGVQQYGCTALEYLASEY